MHEFYHVYFKNLVKSNSLGSANNSEDRVRQQMNADFPELAKYIIGKKSIFLSLFVSANHSCYKH